MSSSSPLPLPLSLSLSVPVNDTSPLSPASLLSYRLSLVRSFAHAARDEFLIAFRAEVESDEELHRRHAAEMEECLQRSSSASSLLLSAQQEEERLGKLVLLEEERRVREEGENEAMRRAIEEQRGLLSSLSMKEKRREVAAKRKRGPTFLLGESFGGCWSTSLVDRMGSFLSTREVVLCERTSKTWKAAFGRSSVWPVTLRRLMEAVRDNREDEELFGGCREDVKGHSGEGEASSPVKALQPSLDDESSVYDVVKSAKVDDEPSLPHDFTMPYPDSPCTPHFHYELTMHNEITGVYTVQIKSRRVCSLYQCAAWSDLFDGASHSKDKDIKEKVLGSASKKNNKKGTTTITMSCALKPKPNNADALDLQFACEMIEMQQQMEVAKADIERLRNQHERDDAIKSALDREASACTREVELIDADLERRSSMHMADELTTQFLKDQRSTLQEQLVEEKKQSQSLRAILAAHHIKQEAEIVAREQEYDRLEAEFAQLTLDKKVLLRLREELRAELENSEWDSNSSMNRLSEVRELIARLKASVK